MMSILVYLLIVSIITFIGIWIILRRGFISFEGLGIFILLLIIVTDWLGLIFSFLEGESGVTQICSERIYPSFLTIIGLLSLMSGLTIADPRPVKIARSFNRNNLKIITQIGYFLIILGLLMNLIAFSLEGISSITAFFYSMSTYIVSQRSWGGFLDKGLSIMLFGLGLVAANQQKRFKQLILVVLMLLCTFFLSTSRGGIILPLIYFIVLLAIFNKDMLKYWIKPSIIVPLALIIILTAGYKSMLRTGIDTYIDTSFDSMFTWGVERFTQRFSDEGLYDGYANFINRTSENNEFYKGEVLKYALTAPIPYVIYKDKPQHPFRGIGDLVYRDFRVSLLDVSAVTIMGTAFADYGSVSLVIYLIGYGMILGFVRKRTVRPGGSILLFVWYIHFMLVEGFSNFIHGGILNLMDAFAFATGSMLLSFIYISLIGTRKKVYHYPQPGRPLLSRSQSIGSFFPNRY